MASNNEEVSNQLAQPGGLPIALDQKVVEGAISKALANFFPTISSAKSAGTDARAEFFQLYKRESEEFDKEYIKKYDEDANTTLIFAGLFSAVASAFLIDAQKNLQPDYAQISAALLQIILYKVNNSTFSSTDFPLPTWNGPTQTMVNVQCLLYTSLAASLMAAFGAMLGKQWINRYSRVDNRGSLIDRSRERQRKFDGMKKWHFDLVMESLPLILQGALLLLGLALSLYLWTIFSLVGAVMIFFTSLGVVFYVTIIICGILWYDCPFQTPSSTLIHALVEYDNKHTKYLSAIYERQHSIVEKCSSMITQAGRQFRRLVRADVEAAVPENEPEVRTEMQKDPTPLFTEEKDTKWNGHIADAQCIRWMQEASTDVDVAIGTTLFISEVQWHSGIVTTPLLDKLWNDFTSWYDPARLSNRMIAETRDKAYVTLKALVHLHIQRRCIDNSISLGYGLNPYLFHSILKPDDQLRSTLLLLDGILNSNFHPMHHYVSVFSIQHLAWLLHIIQYRLMKDESVRNDIDIHKFIRKVLEHDHSPSILTDCLFVVALTIGMPVHINDLMVIDKSERIDDVVCLLFEQITWRIEHSIDLGHLYRTMETLKTLTYCQKPPECVSVACYDLCHRTLGSTIEDRKIWEASQLVMQIGFRHSSSLRLFGRFEGWPATGLNFLEHQFALEHQDESDYVTTADVFSALSNVRPERDTDLTKTFLSGMIASLQVDKSRLKSQIIRFISRFHRQIIDAGVEAMSEEEKRNLLSVILSEVNTQLGKGACINILIDAIRSDVWRRYLGLEHLNLLESLVSSFGSGDNIFDVYQDTDLISALADENLLNGAILKTWVQVIWLDLHRFLPDSKMTQQAQSAIKELFIRRPDLMDDFQMAINSQAQNRDYRGYRKRIKTAR